MKNSYNTNPKTQPLIFEFLKLKQEKFQNQHWKVRQQIDDQLREVGQNTSNNEKVWVI